MKIYHYNSVSGEYLGVDTARPDPLEAGKFLIPAHATALEPPELEDGKACVFKNGAWFLIDDQRGTQYWLADGTHHTITELGATKPEGSLDTVPVQKHPLLKRLFRKKS